MPNTVVINSIMCRNSSCLRLVGRSQLNDNASLIRIGAPIPSPLESPSHRSPARSRAARNSKQGASIKTPK